MSTLLKHLFNPLARSTIFSPPKYYSSPPEGVSVRFMGGVPFVLLEREALRGPKEGEEELEVALLYAHGNSEDVFMAQKHLGLLLERIHEHFPACSLKLLVWDYPTYGVSREGKETIQKYHLMKTAELMLSLLLEDWHKPRFTVAVGSSLGCVFAAHLSQNPSVDCVLLLTPFASLVSGSAYAGWGWLVDDEFDVVEELQEAHKEVHVKGVFVGRDPVLPLEQNRPRLGPSLDSYEVVDSGDHNYFTTFDGARAVGDLVKELLLLRAMDPQKQVLVKGIREMGLVENYLGEEEVQERLYIDPYAMEGPD